MIHAGLSTSDYSQALQDSSLVGQLERSQALLQRVADLDRVYCSLLGTHLASGGGRLGLDKLSRQYLSNVYRACEALLNGSSQVERQVFKYHFNQETDALPAIIQTSRTTTPKPGS